MKRMIGIALALTGLFAGNASAYGRNLVDIEVIDRETGRQMPLFESRGNAYIAGEPGHRYSVNLRNRSGERVLAVLSVDGVNAITGQSANPQQSGYVLAPYQSTQVSGWRKSNNQVAQFVFTAPWDSYAARTGRPRNIGVIGVAVFREAEPIWYRDDQEISRYKSAPSEPGRAGQSAPAPAADAASGSGALAKRSAPSSRDQHSELGTAHGDREYAPVRTTEFRRASNRPDAIVELQYDTYAHLVERGVIPRRSRIYEREPRAFAGHFVPDP